MPKSYRFSFMYTDNEGRRRRAVGTSDSKEDALAQMRDMKAGVLADNPEAFTAPRKSPAEIEAAINTASGILKDALALLWYTHIRATELLALMPQDIGTDTITVNKYRNIAGKEIFAYGPKTQYAAPLTDDARAVFGRLTQPPVGEPFFSRLSYTRIVRAAGKCGLRLRDLRQ